MSAELRNTDYAYGANSIYIAEIYEQFLRNPQSVPQDWQDFFRSVGDSEAGIDADFGGAPWATEKSTVVGLTEKRIERRKFKGAGRRKTDNAAASSASIRAHMLIRAYRVRGHLLANLDPLGLTGIESHPELEPQRYGFTEGDYNEEIYLGGWLGLQSATLQQVMSILRETYSSNFAVEFIHIQSLERKEWLEERIEKSRGKPSLTNEEKRDILKQLIDAVGFEEFLHTKYPGAKRFSVEGGEALLPAMEMGVRRSASLGVKEVVLGMPHRGRLSVLTAFMQKPYAAMLSEFEGNLATPDEISASGDVKYHLGISADRKFQEAGKEAHDVHLSLTANPSHLEAVNPVVAGKVRAKQDQRVDNTRDEVMGILLHGDAAFCGQGVVAETLALSDLDGYSTGGTFHIVVNNQIGFTTSPKFAHKSPYPTDVAMMAQAPIFHVNGDDPEAVIHAAHIAAEYRQKFKKDVVLDIFCYRKYGHNEGDEPMFTQPLMYKNIAERPTVRDIYARRLIDESVITEAEYEEMKGAQHKFLDSEHERSKNYRPDKADMLEGKWEGIKMAEAGEKPKCDTGIDIAQLKDIGMKISAKPEHVNINSKVARMLDAKRKMIETGEGLDWATGEALAFGSLMLENTKVRLSGQDVTRGTFSHRHSALIDQETEEYYYPLKNLAETQADIEIVNSALSEFAVLGFEYGYSLAEPNTLTLWEGQFGDFYNGAQIIVDQFISSSEVKWLRMSGLVMLLPHGYEGQGPEHSSARPERFLQMCAEDNWQVANCTTPANYFHILRRQIRRDFRKPLVLMTPKSLLRHKRAQSRLEDMASGTNFLPIIPEHETMSDDKVRKVVICSGKVYYDILEEREKRGIKDVAIIRMEQYYPFPQSDLQRELARYKNADVVWAQEEPANMGAWNFVDRRIEAVLTAVGGKCKRPSYAGRNEAAATATGYMRLHVQEQQKLIDDALK